MQEVFAPIFENEAAEKKVLIGCQARMAESHALDALNAAVASWNHGRGAWAQASPETRILKVQELVEALKPKRAEIISVLMWEICKVRAIRRAQRTPRAPMLPPPAAAGPLCERRMACASGSDQGRCDQGVRPHDGLHRRDGRDLQGAASS